MAQQIGEKQKPKKKKKKVQAKERNQKNKNCAILMSRSVKPVGSMVSFSDL